jgi:hypothetical protein
MRDFLLCWSVLLAVLVSSAALSSDPDEKIVIRNEMITDHPGISTSSVYVSGQIATVLRFEKDVDPLKTKLLAWEGRFEPLLVGSKMVVIVPIRDLNRDEAVPLLVTLVDGTEIPFIVKPQSFETWGWTDHQVNVFKNPNSYNAVLSSLNDSLNRERKLQAKVERYEQQDSVDHALAALMAKDATRQTSFRERKKYVLQEGGVEFVVRLFSGKGKAAVVFTITNREDAPWKLKMARLYTASGWKDKPFALRTDTEAVTPGTTGYVAVVADRSAFQQGAELKELLLEIYRDDGYRQLFVLLDPSLARE